MTSPQLAAPRYNLTRVFQLRDSLANDALSEFAGYAPRGEHFEDLVTGACDAVPRVQRQTMFDSLRYLAGTLINAQELLRVSWRLAGNVTRLRDGIAVPPWHAQREPEWVPAQILSWTADKMPNGRPAGRFQLRVLAGTACPMKITTFWPRNFCFMVSRRVGYSARWHSRPFSHPSELVNMRIWALLDPAHCRPGIPGFREIGCSAGLLKWNRAIISKRFRQDGWRCPEGLDYHCFKCPIGYLACPAATHRHTVEIADAEDHGVRDGEVGHDSSDNPHV